MIDAKQAAVFNLQLEYIRECLTLVSVKAAHASDNIQIEDFTCAERDIGFAVDFLKQAAQEFRKYQEDFAKARKNGSTPSGGSGHRE